MRGKQSPSVRLSQRQSLQGRRLLPPRRARPMASLVDPLESLMSRRRIPEEVRLVTYPPRSDLPLKARESPHPAHAWPRRPEAMNATPELDEQLHDGLPVGSASQARSPRHLSSAAEAAPKVVCRTRWTSGTSAPGALNARRTSRNTAIPAQEWARSMARQACRVTSCRILRSQSVVHQGIP